MQIPNFVMDGFNIKQQILSIETQIKNIEMQMDNKMGIQMNNNMGMPNFNNFGIQMNNNGKINENNNNKKKLVIFSTNLGERKDINFDYGIIIDGILRKYLEEMKKPELINSTKVSFVFNVRKLNFGDKMKIEDLFKNMPEPKIIVFFFIEII